MKKILLLALVLAGFVGTTNAQITELGKYKLYFQNNNNWSNPHLFVKNESNTENVNHAWPGDDISNNVTTIDGYTYYFYEVDLASLGASNGTAVTINFNDGTSNQSYDWTGIKYDAFFSIATTPSETGTWNKYNLTRETKYYLYDTSSLSIKLDLVSGNVYGAYVDNTTGNSKKQYVVADTNNGGAFNWGNGFNWSENIWRPWNTAKDLGWQIIELSDNNCYKGTGDNSWGFISGFKYFFTINPIDASGDNYKFGVIPSFTRTITDAGIATFSSQYAVTIPSGITASYVTGVTNNVLNTESFTGVIPANTGALIMGDAGPYTFTPGTTSNSVSNPWLIPVTEDKIDENGRIHQEDDTPVKYILTTNEGSSSPRFYMVNETSGNKISVGQAYLVDRDSPNYDTEGGAREYFNIWDESNSIEAVAQEQHFEGQVYNLAGQRIAQPTKGLYIVNGKKVIKK